MLYFIKSREYYKIGYSDNFKTRLHAYKIHNPDFELIGTREGTRKDEFKYHCYLSKYNKNKNKRSEWVIIEDIRVLKFIEETFTSKSKLEIPSIIRNTLYKKSYKKLIEYIFETRDESLYQEYPEFEDYLKYLTLKEINSMRYNKEKLMVRVESKKRLESVIDSVIHEGFMTSKEIKDQLKKKFSEYGLTISPKASLIEESKKYSVMATTARVDGNVVHGYKIQENRNYRFLEK